ncbi:hypothetical protein FP026_11320 [Rhizobium tropici]|uniref:Uncharacterized protein n=1 Tax=Rhizobium tropici TaxID=398 RepID=A0A5B0W7L0_RHITR|nr:hypothetical protein [Rhizobium tropici]KAA1182652.1 hypothetical protein FP026_11320 [Rhizobium tropici]
MLFSNGHSGAIFPIAALRHVIIFTAWSNYQPAFLRQGKDGAERGERLRIKGGIDGREGAACPTG